MKKIIYILSIIALTSFLSSCESETSILQISDAIGFTGSTNDIKEFLGEDVYQAMRDAGLIIHPGANPNIINGSFYIDPLCFAPVDGDLDCEFFPFTITCSNQNNTALTINYAGIQFDNEGNVVYQDQGNGLISGDENGYFTIYVKGTNDDGDESASAFSGRITSSGIENYQQIFIFDINASIIAGSVFVDGDEFSEKL